MKSLFDDNECYTEEAVKLDNEMSSLIKPVVKRYIEMGYSTREIENIIITGVTMVAVEERLHSQVKRSKAKRHAKNNN